MTTNNKLDQYLRNRGFDINYKHHVVFWVAYFIFNILRWTSINNDLGGAINTNLIEFPLHIAITYFNLYYLMPKFVYTKKYIQYGIFLAISLIVLLLIKYNVTHYILSNGYWPNVNIPEVIDGLTINYALETIIGEFYVIAFVTALKITLDWMRENDKLHMLEKEQLTTELKFLRSQVSPHFFFNTLNNIYSLTLEKSDKAPIVILKLSELMRYLLYSISEPRQSLKAELDCIQNYIDLERIRFDNSLEITVGISGELENKKIAPMLLIPLVENCFKHGANKNIGKVDICINAKVIDDFLYFEVSNTIPSIAINIIDSERDNGIGLSNVKKRLELGYDQAEYDLDIFEHKDKFHVKLKLKV
jgi:LytS/YehU family sensor histidine kinase